MKEKVSENTNYELNGVDEFTRFLTFLALVLAVAGNLVGVGTALSVIICVAALGILIYGQFRCFSANVKRRRAENERYRSFTKGIRGIFHRESSIFDDETHRVFSCPECGQKIRVPRGKGRIEIKCPKCQERFIKRS